MEFDCKKTLGHGEVDGERLVSDLVREEEDREEGATARDSYWEGEVREMGEGSRAGEQNL